MITKKWTIFMIATPLFFNLEHSQVDLELPRQSFSILYILS